MGAEFRIEITPNIDSLDAHCDALFAASQFQWKRIATSLLEHPNGIGVRLGRMPVAKKWPNIADLCVNEDRSFYAVAHCNPGVVFLYALKTHLETEGYSVVLDDNYY